MILPKLKFLLLPLSLAACMSAGTMLSYGTDSGTFARDGECDDPRFTGGGMADSLNLANVEKDATDCRALAEAGAIRPVRTRAQWKTEQCSSLSYGNNSSKWARDGECDDPRFTGPGVDDITLPIDKMADAADCRKACLAGEAWPK